MGYNSISVMLFSFISCLASDAYYESKIKDDLLDMYKSNAKYDEKINVTLDKYSNWMIFYSKYSTSVINPIIEDLQKSNHKK